MQTMIRKKQLTTFLINASVHRGPAPPEAHTVHKVPQKTKTHTGPARFSLVAARLSTQTGCNADSAPEEQVAPQLTLPVQLLNVLQIAFW